MFLQLYLEVQAMVSTLASENGNELVFRLVTAFSDNQIYAEIELY